MESEKGSSATHHHHDLTIAQKTLDQKKRAFLGHHKVIREVFYWLQSGNLNLTGCHLILHTGTLKTVQI